MPNLELTPIAQTNIPLPSAPLLHSDEAPNAGCLTRFARTRCGQLVGSKQMKYSAGAIAGIGFLVFAFIASSVLTGGLALVVYALIGLGLALYLLSTATSASNLSQDESLKQHLADSFCNFTSGFMGGCSGGLMALAQLFDYWVEQRRQRAQFD